MTLEAILKIYAHVELMRDLFRPMNFCEFVRGACYYGMIYTQGAREATNFFLHVYYCIRKRAKSMTRLSRLSVVSLM